MAITAKVVANTLATTGDTAFTSSGFGTPDAAIIFVSRGNTTNNPATNAQMSAGFWCADPAQAGVAFASQDAVGTSNAGRYGGDVNAAPVLSSDVASLVVQYSAASTTDGINLSVAAGSTTINRHASVLLLKGVTNAHVGAINLGTGTSAINVTAPGFRADLVLFLGAWAADETVSASARFTFGAAKIDGADTVTQGCVVLESRDNAAATDTSTAIHNDVAAAKILSTALGAEISVSANANGFTVTPSADSASNVLYYLALELPSPNDSYVGVVDTQTGTGNLAYDVTAFEPLALLLAGTMCTATGTLTEAGSMHLGMATSGSQWGTTFIDEDASDPSDNESYADTSNILNIPSAVGSTDTIARLDSLDADGWTLNYSDGSASARKMLAIAIGNSSAGGTTVTPGSGSITATGYAPTISQPHTVSPAAGAVSALGYAPSLIQGVSVSPGAGSATYTGLTPTISQPHTVAPSAGAATILGYAPSIQQAAGIYPGAGAVEYAGQTPTISQPHTVSPGVGAYDVLGYAPTVSQAAGVAPLAGSIIVLGYAPAISQPITVAPGAGAATWLGYAPTISQEAMTLTQADLDAIAAAVWADPVAVAAHAKLDAIIARITC